MRRDFFQRRIHFHFAAAPLAILFPVRALQQFPIARLAGDRVLPVWRQHFDELRIVIGVERAEYFR